MYHASIESIHVRDGDQGKNARQKVLKASCELLSHIIASMLSWLLETRSPPTPLVLDLAIDEKRAFTSLERFTGRLTIKALVDTSFDELDLKLIGTSRTYGRRVVPQAPSARTVTTAHRFLELTQPDVLSNLPESRLFKAGCIYEIPFEFAVPDRMLPATCRHPVANADVHLFHTSMPPSFGDHKLSEGSDYAPRNASVKYRIVAKVERKSETGEHSEIASSSEPIRFIPMGRARSLSIANWSPARSIQATISLRKLWAIPSGKLVAKSMQTTPFVVKDSSSSLWLSRVSGFVKINLSFHPIHDGAQPPGQINLNAILRSKTISAVSPLEQLPSDDPWSGPRIDKHTAPSVILTPQATESIEWVRGIRETTDGVSCPSYEYPPAYTASRNAPSSFCYSATITVSLDSTLAFLLAPTFHACLITRMYDLDLRLSVPGSSLGLGSAMRLTLPVQVILEGAAKRCDSAVVQKDALGSDLGFDLMCETLGSTDSQGPPPDYRRTRT